MSALIGGRPGMSPPTRAPRLHGTDGRLHGTDAVSRPQLRLRVSHGSATWSTAPRRSARGPARTCCGVSSGHSARWSVSRPGGPGRWPLPCTMSVAPSGWCCAAGDLPMSCWCEGDGLRRKMNCCWVGGPGRCVLGFVRPFEMVLKLVRHESVAPIGACGVDTPERRWHGASSMRRTGRRSAQSCRGLGDSDRGLLPAARGSDGGGADRFHALGHQVRTFDYQPRCRFSWRRGTQHHRFDLPDTSVIPTAVPGPGVCG